jgi:hypothetical protein
MIPAVNRERLRFFLGGRDLEMYAPGQALDKRLAWGAKLSDYAIEITETAAAGRTPVAVELTDDMPPDWTPRRDLIVVDHHGKLAGANMPCSLAQVLKLLDLPKRAWTRRRMLIAANDIGHVPAMIAAGATRDEFLRIRGADRRAQGVTAADEDEAARAIDQRYQRGNLTVVETTSDTSSAIADGMLRDLGGPGYVNLLVVMPAKLGFFGEGRVVLALAATKPCCWYGGALPARGFWGASTQSKIDQAGLVKHIVALTTIS